MGELLAPLRDDLESPIDGPRMDRIFEGLRQYDFRRPSRRRPRMVIIAAAAIGSLLLGAAGVASWLYGDGRAPVDEGASPLRLMSGEPLTTLMAPRGGNSTSSAGFELEDGSSITLSRGARIEALENTGSELVLGLESGRAAFDVRPNRRRRWVIDAGLVSIAVVGTAFSVEHSDAAVMVSVTRGEVRLEGEAVSGRLVRLVRGESMTVRREVAEPEACIEEAPNQSTEETEEPLTAESSGGSAQGESWRTLAAQRAYPEAYELLGSAGIAEETARATQVDELFALADVARLSGHPRDAVQPLERIIEGYASHGRAAVAAFTLGRLHLEVLSDPHRARRAFERTIQLGAPPGLREDALARLVEAHARAGDRAAARASAAEYLRRHPEGRLAPQVRSWAGLAGE